MVAQSVGRERVITNPAIGDRVTFLKTTEETNGEYLLLRIELAPHGGNPLHYHRTFTEEFRVLNGRLNVDLDDQRLVLGAGDSALASVGARHRFYSTSDEPTLFMVEVRPARQTEDVLRMMYGLASDSKASTGGGPKNVLHLAYLATLADSYPAGVPLWLLRPSLGVLARVARWRGVDKALATYL